MQAVVLVLTIWIFGSPIPAAKAIVAPSGDACLQVGPALAKDLQDHNDSIRDVEWVCVVSKLKDHA